ncbi:hypothetical protein [Kineococcus indalonis]|nr:hypothetical protein [Kineococcus indalonis]
MHEAFTRLRAHARRSGSPLTAVAAAVVEGGLRLEGDAQPARRP